MRRIWLGCQTKDLLTKVSWSKVERKPYHLKLCFPLLESLIMLVLATESMMFNWLQSSLCSSLSLSLSLCSMISQTAIPSHTNIHLPWWVGGHRRKRLGRKMLVRDKLLVPVIVMPLLLILFCKKMLFVTWEIDGHIIKWSSSYMCLNISNVCYLTFDVNNMTIWIEIMLWTRSQEREREKQKHRHSLSQNENSTVTTK